MIIKFVKIRMRTSSLEEGCLGGRRTFVGDGVYCADEIVVNAVLKRGAAQHYACHAATLGDCSALLEVGGGINAAVVAKPSEIIYNHYLVARLITMRIAVKLKALKQFAR